MVEYRYDAWGKLLSVTGSLADTVGQTNPFRYRGYYYDVETGLYYLNTRYYDPETGRFISADIYVSTGQDIIGANMYAYCGNNPISRCDPTGMFWKEIGDFLSNVWNDIENFLFDYTNEYSDIPQDNFALYGEHHKKGTTNPSNRNKHQKGQTRKQKDNNGEKKNNSPNWKPNPNKRRISTDSTYSNIGERIAFGAVAVGASVVVVCLAVNDVSGVGIIDNSAIAPLIRVIWDSAAKAVS